MYFCPSWPSGFRYKNQPGKSNIASKLFELEPLKTQTRCNAHTTTKTQLEIVCCQTRLLWVIWVLRADFCHAKKIRRKIWDGNESSTKESILEKNNMSGRLPAEYKYLDDVYGAFEPLLFPFGLRMFVFWTHLAECCEIAVLALHQELGRDVSGWFDFAGFLILLMELLNPLFSRHHLQGSKISKKKFKRW